VSIAGPLRRTLSELSNEAGDVIILSLGLAIFFAVVPALVQGTQMIESIIPGARITGT